MEQLWLNSPVGYPYCEKIEKNEVDRLRRFLLMILSGGGIQTQKEIEEIGNEIRQASHAQIIRMLEANHFTFDTEWYGPREIKNQYGAVMSALDDVKYRTERGIGHGI